MKNVIGHFIAAFGLTSRFPGDAKSNCYKKKMFIGKKKTHTVMMCSLIHCKKNLRKHSHGTFQDRWLIALLLCSSASSLHKMAPAPRIDRRIWNNTPGQTANTNAFPILTKYQPTQRKLVFQFLSN